MFVFGDIDRLQEKAEIKQTVLQLLFNPQRVSILEFEFDMRICFHHCRHSLRDDDRRCPPPMEIQPVIISSLCEISRLVFSQSIRISSARLRSSTPSSVRVTPLLLRINSCFPNSASSSISCFESEGCAIFRLFDARVIFPSRATVRKYRNKRSSIVIRSLQNIVCTLYDLLSFLSTMINHYF